jgi:hypothetical protein
MRKVTQQICTAFLKRQPAVRGNTRTDGTTLWLYDNAIAQWRNEQSEHHGYPSHGAGEVWITLAGWPTPLTFDRLRGLGAKVNMHRGQAIKDGCCWDGTWTRL